MSAFTVTTGSRSGAGFATRLARFFGDLPHEWSLRQARHAMGHLDDAVLHDLGVDRGDIAAVVRHGRQALRS